MRILVIRLHLLGDLAHSLPVLADLRVAYPDATFDWLVADDWAEFLTAFSDINRTWVYPRRVWRGPWQVLARLADVKAWFRHLAAEPYDLVIDLHGQLRTGFIAWWLGRTARAKGRFCRVIGPAGVWASEALAARFYDEVIGPSAQEPLHAVVRARRLVAAAIGSQHQDPRELGGGYGLPRFAIKRIGPDTSPLTVTSVKKVLFVPNSAREQKCWPHDNWALLARRLLSDESANEIAIEIAWGSDTEKQRAEDLVRAAQPSEFGNSLGRIGPAPKRTQAEWVTALGSYALICGNDTGLVQLALVQGFRVVTIYVDSPRAWTAGLFSGQIDLGDLKSPPPVNEAEDACRQILRLTQRMPSG